MAKRASTPRKPQPAAAVPVVKRLSIGKKLIFSVVILLAATILLEAAMILLDPLVGVGFYQYDRDLGFRVRANTHGTNRFGFNDRDYPLEKPAGTYRILIANDSFGWAGGREGNYTETLERLLLERYGEGRIEVINSGYPMTHTGEQLEMLRKFGLQYDPDLVIHGFFVGNDFVDSHRYRKRIVVNDTTIDVDRRRERILFGYPIVPQSRLLHVVRQRVRLLAERIRSSGETAAGSDPADVAGAFSPQTFARIERARMEFCNVRNHQAGRYTDHLAFTRENLTAMAELLRSREIEFVVALYPDEFQVNSVLARELVATFGLEPSLYELQLPQQLVSAHMESLQVPVIDLLAPFRQHGRGETLYLPRNTHWNSAGRRLAGESLFEALVPMLDRALGEAP
jgi:hypothetical protein